MKSRVVNHVAHYQPRPACVVDCDHAATGGKSLQLKSLTYVIRTSSLFHRDTDSEQLSATCASAGRPRRCASDNRVQSTDCMDRIHAIPEKSVQLRLSGGVPCMEHCRSESTRLGKSNDVYVRVLTKLSAPRNSSVFARPYGLSTLRRISPLSLEKMSARARAGSLASSRRRRSCSPTSTWRLPATTNFSSGSGLGIHEPGSNTRGFAIAHQPPSGRAAEAAMCPAAVRSFLAGRSA